MIRMRGAIGFAPILTVVSWLLAFVAPVFAGTEPLPRIYACSGNGLNECRAPTPVFDSCDAWGAWKISLFTTGGPYTIQEAEYSAGGGASGLQCLVLNVGGSLAALSLDAGACQTSTDTVSGPDPFNRICTGTGSKPAKQMACPKPSAGTSSVANPINCAPAVGNKYEVALDYVGTGPFPLRLERYYNSVGTTFFPGMFSQAFAMANWRHSYERSISLMVRQGISFARVDRKDGNSLNFTLVGSTWTPGELDITERLEQAVENAQSVWKFTNLDDEVERYSVQTGRLLSITNRAGLTQTVVFDASNRVGSVTDPFGRNLVFSYGAANCSGARCVASVQDPNGNLIQYGYDTVSLGGNSFTRLRTITYPGTPAPRTYNYDTASVPLWLIGIIDENGDATASWTYDGLARGTSSQHAGGAEKVTLQYLSGTSTQVTAAISAGGSPVNRVNTYQYQTIQRVQRLTAITGDVCPSCGPKASQYDANGYLSQVTDWNNNVTTYLRQDATRRELETQRVEASGTPQARTITTQWHPTFRLPTSITEPGRTTSMTYDATTGNLLTRTSTDTALGRNRTWTYTYNANGQVFTMNGPRTDVSDVTTYAYYANDDSDLGKRASIATVTNAKGHVTSITAYNAHGQPLTIVDPNGLTTTLTYDPRLRLTSRMVGGELTSYAYDGVGQLRRVTMPDTSYLNYTYDAAHRLAQIDDSLGNKIVYTLDAMGNRRQEQVFDPANALAQTRSRVYNNLNRLSQEIGAQGQTTAFGYDNQGNLTSIDGPLAGTVDITTNAYDALNRVTRVTDPQLGQVNYGYNALDQMTSVRDPRNLTTGYAYDALNNLNQLSSPDTGATQNTYDNAGNLLTQVDAKGQTTTHTYDVLNRVTSIAYATDAPLNVAFTYDQGASGIGRLTGVTDNSGTMSYAYNIHGRLTSDTKMIGGVTYVTRYEHDSVGRLLSMTYPGGRWIGYARDGLGRVSGIITSKNGVTQTLLTGVAYRPFGPERAFTFGNNQTYTRGFDQDGRIASYALPGQTFSVGYDLASRISSIGVIGNPATTVSYGYDPLDRLIQAVEPFTSRSFGYDAAGNRISQTIGGNSYSATPAATSNRIIQVSGPTPKTFSFDANGSITNNTVNQFTYDARGRLKQATTVLGVAQYLVNSLGQRVKKSVAGIDTVFHYDSGGRLISETDAQSNVRQEYVHLNDIPVAVLK